MIYLRLFWEFFKTGLFSVGGGLATLPFLSDIADKTGWFTQTDLANMVAVAESTPGPIGINTATYVGYQVAGIPGGIIATLGLAAPSVLVILLIAGMLKRYRHNIWVERLFYGLRPASIGMISAVFVSLLLSAVAAPGIGAAAFTSWFNWPCLALGIAIFLLTCIFKKWHPVLFLLLAGAAGVVLRLGG